MPLLANTENPNQSAVDKQLELYLHLTFVNRKDEADAALDNVISQFNQQTPIASKVQALSYRILDRLIQEQPSQAQQEADVLLQQAKLSADPDVIAEALATKLRTLTPLGIHQDNRALVEELERYLDQCQQLRIKYLAHNLLGRLYMASGEYEPALLHFTRSLDAVLASPQEERKALHWVSLNKQIAIIQYKLRNLQAAMTILDDTINLALKEKIAIELPELYLLKGSIEGEQGQWDKAIVSNEQVLYWAKQQDNKNMELRYLNNIGDSYLQTRQYDRARNMFEQALDMAKELADKQTEDVIRFNLGSLLIKQGKKAQGISLLEDATKGMRVYFDKADLQDLLGEVAENYQQAGMYQRQAESLLEQRNLREEIFRVGSDRHIEELNERYQSKDKANRIKLLEQERINQDRLLENKKLQQQITELIAVLAILIIPLLWLLYFRVKQSSLWLKQTNLKLRQETLQDPLTGLSNRRALHQRMQKNISSGIIKDPSNGGVFLLMDIDKFKQINDLYGHESGDDVLKEMAKRLAQVCRESDMLMRWGGEEFLLYLPNIKLNDVEELVHRVLNIITSTPFQTGDKLISVTLSGGVVAVSASPTNSNHSPQTKWEDGLKLADMALYYSKKQGRNRICCIKKLAEPVAKIVKSDNLSTALAENQLTINMIKGLSSLDSTNPTTAE